MGVHVTPEQPSAAGTRILAAADGLHGDVSTLDATAAGFHGANGACAVASVAADRETGWEDAPRPLGAGNNRVHDLSPGAHDSRPSARNMFLWLENRADGFRITVQANDLGEPYLVVTSPCVWPS